MPEPEAYRRAVAYIESLVLPEPRSRAERERLGHIPIRRLLRALGDPQAGVPCIHVAGSKGKGSVVLIAESILAAAGLSTGTYTSPHLSRWTERIRVGGREVTPLAFAAAVDRVRSEAERLAREDPWSAPGFFDVLTAAAMVTFADAGVEWALVETGLGGRLDPTGACDARVTAITTIEYEHTDKLGDTLEAIAGEKAGIARRGVPMIHGALPPPALARIRAAARDIGAPLASAPRWHAGEPATRLVVELPGDPAVLDAEFAFAAVPEMAANAAIAAGCVAATGALDATRLRDAIARGLADLRLPGRLEVVARDPWIVVDGAHTRSSAAALAAWLATLPASRRRLAISVTRGKDAAAVLAPLLAGADRIWVTRADPDRSRPAGEVAALIAAVHPELAIETIDDPRLALERARASLEAGDLLCVTGSMYLAGLGRELLAEGPGGRPRSGRPPAAAPSPAGL